MPKSAKRAYESDEGAPTAKRGKTSSSSLKSSSAGPQKTSDGELYWELSSNRRVSITEFKGKRMVNIREYYEKDGQHLPGKKGITLPLEQYNTLLSVLPQIEESLSKDGEEVVRPDYEGNGGGSGKGRASRGVLDGEEEDEEKEEEDGKMDGANGESDRSKVRKGNHDATSDEEE